MKTCKILNTNLLIAFLAFFSCTERITLPTNDADPTIVVYGLLDADEEVQSLRLSLSAPYFDDAPNEDLSNAKVTIISSSGKQFSFVEHDSIKGYYHTLRTSAIEPDTEYFLTIEADINADGNSEIFEAKTEVLPTQEGDSLTFQKLELFGMVTYVLHLYLTDIPGDDYYMFKILYNDSILDYSINSTVITDDKMFPEQQISLNLYNFLDYDNYDTDPEYMQENAIYLKDGDSVEVKFCRIPKNYFDFISQCQNEMTGENPLFGGPASNIVTNISNGGVGFFAGCAYSKLKTVFRKPDDQ